MDILIVCVVALGLAMDAFSVALCKGSAMKKLEAGKIVTIASYFGLFQGLMPMVGFYIGSLVLHMIYGIEHWISLILLGGIGINMLREAFDKDDMEFGAEVDFKSMILIAIATSVDALILGMIFSFFEVDIFVASLIVCVITFLLSAVGVVLGNKFTAKNKLLAEILGGAIFIIVGIKIVIEYFGII